MAEFAHDLSNGPMRESPESVPAASPTDQKTLPIFVVDDEPLVGQSIGMVLAFEGYQTQIFQNPVLALQALTAANPRPKLLITDFAMAGLNGLQLIEQCLKLEPALKTILISGNISQETVRQFPTKPDHFLFKPFPPKLLAGLVADLLA